MGQTDLFGGSASEPQATDVNERAAWLRNELNRQTTALVQRLQDNISEEIPMLVADVLQENLLNVLNEIKQSQSQ